MIRIGRLFLRKYSGLRLPVLFRCFGKGGGDSGNRRGFLDGHPSFQQIGEKRVVIQIEGLIAVATAAIPAALVERIG